MSSFTRLALLLCALIPRFSFGQAVPPNLYFNVRTFGAQGDGVALDTPAITKAIAAAHEAGGGIVLFPPGTYLSGTFEILGNVTLDLQAGALLQATSDLNAYGSIAAYGFGRNYGLDSSGEGFRVGLIVARHAENIAIIGQGRIDGNGDLFFDPNSPHNGADFDPRYTRQGASYDAPQAGMTYGPIETRPDGRPGTLIILSDCRNVSIRDITLSNAPNWTLHLQGTEQATISGIHIANNVLIPNNDGIDCMRCKSVNISDCDIRAGDDDFAIVSSDDVHINNCSVFSYSAAVRLEDSRDTTFSNLSMHTNRGIAVFGRGDQHTAHVLFSNIVMDTKLIPGHWWGKAEPIYIAARGGTGKGAIEDIRFTNITADAEGGIVFDGAPGSIIRNIYLSQIRMALRAPDPRIAQSVGGNFDLRWTAKDLSEAIFTHDIPAIYVRHADGLRIRDFDLTWGPNLPAYFSAALQVQDSTPVDYSDFQSTGLPGAPSRPFLTH